MPIYALGGAAIASGALSGILGADASKKQAKAALKAQREQIAYQREQMANQRAAGYEASGLINSYADSAANQLESNQRIGDQYMAQGLAGAESAMNPLLGMSRYADMAAQGINPYDLEGKAAAMYKNFEADPGYQFRQQQGEQALMRSAAARGGRLGSGTLKELMGYNQGMASQEFNNYANRNLGVLMNQAGRADQAALQAQANQLSLGQMGLAGYSDLSKLRYGYGQDMGNRSSQYGANLSNISMSAGQARGNAILQSNMAGALPSFGMNVPYAGGASQAWGNAATSTLGNLTGLAAMSMKYGGNNRVGEEFAL